MEDNNKPLHPYENKENHYKFVEKSKINVNSVVISSTIDHVKRPPS